ncbi:MAG: Phenylacetic acid catabolic protein, partial [Pseudomonadota bacterium]|nr:Phenylacetic acid catabolic protein [Pseudomonadota bacterium]
PDLSDLQTRWTATVKDILDEATLTLPERRFDVHTGGKQGRHTEHLGYLLAEMQFLQRAYPGAEW